MGKRKAIALLSGGLDSALAVKLMLDQGIEVMGVFLKSPFGCPTNAHTVADHLQIPLKIVDKGAAYIDLVQNPQFGYGRNMNPCIDCRIYMFLMAKRVMNEEGADFVITGEVLGQRPMSQIRPAMEIIDHESGMKRLVLRPLSAKHLHPTLPEIEKWVDRNRLLNISGRSRKFQMQLASELGLKGYGSPAGGCLLTDPNFSGRLSEFFKNEKWKSHSMTEVNLLRYGRHFYLSDGSHLLLGRNERENEIVWREAKSEVESGKAAFFRPLFSGPSAVLWGCCPTPVIRQEAGELILRYTTKEVGENIQVEVLWNREKSEFSVNVSARVLPMVTSG